MTKAPPKRSNQQRSKKSKNSQKPTKKSVGSANKRDDQIPRTSSGSETRSQRVKNGNRNAKSETVKTTKDHPKDSMLAQKKLLLNKFVKDRHWNLMVDIFLLFAITVGYGIALYFTEPYISIIFIVFALICCIIISTNYYNDEKEEITKVINDLEILLKNA